MTAPDGERLRRMRSLIVRTVRFLLVLLDDAITYQYPLDVTLDQMVVLRRALTDWLEGLL